MTFFDGDINTQGKYGLSALWQKYQGESGFILNNQEIAIIEKYNQLTKESGVTHRQLWDALKGCNQETKLYIKNTGYQTVELKRVGKATLLGATGLKGLATAARAAAAQIKLVAAQFTLFFIATEALNLIIKGFTWLKDNVIPTKNNLRTWAEDAATAFKETQSELETVENELKTIQDRIQELKDAGPLTLTEQDELHRLQLENFELEKRLAILKEEAKLKQAESVEKNVDALHSFDYSDSKTVDEGNGIKYKVAMTMPEAFSHYAEMYQKWLDELNKIDPSDKNAKDRYETISEFVDKYRNAITELSGEISEYRVNIDDVSDEEKEYIRTLYKAENAALNLIGVLPTDSLIQVSLSADEYERFNAQLKELALSSEEITDSSLQNYLGKDLCDKLTEAGVNFASLTEEALAYRDAQLEVNDAITKLSIPDEIDSLALYEEKVKSLSDACNQFADNKEVSTSALQAIAENFADVADTPEFKQLIDNLNDTSKTSDEVRRSAEALLNIYELESDALNGVTEDTKQLYIRRLELMGVTNAEQVVELELAKTRLANAEAGSEEEAQAYQTIDAILKESNALYRLGVSALDASDRLETIKAAEKAISDENFDSVLQSHGEMFLKVAAAAGMSGTYIQQYLDILANLRNAEIRADAGNTGAQRAVLEYTNQLNKIKSNVQAELKSIFDPNNQSWSPVDDSKGKNTSSDAYNKEKARLDNQLERNLTSYNDYYAKLVKLGNKYFKKGSDDMATHYATLADVRRSAYAKYQGELDNQLANNSITLNAYYTKSQALADKWLDGRKANEEDYAEAVATIYDKVVEQWNDRVSAMETQMERWTLDKTWAPGISELSVWQDQLAQLQKDYVAGLFDDTNEYYDIYYDILKRIRDLESEELEKQLDDLEDRADGVQDLIDMVDDMLRQRIEDQIDALEGLEDKYQDIVDAKKESLDLTREELAYQRELEESNKELADLQAKAALLALDDSREGKAQYAAIMEEIRNKQLEISDSQADHTYDATTDALDEATEKYQAHIQEQIDDLNEMTENQGEWLQYVYKYIETTDPSQLFRELRDYNYKYGDGMNQTVADIESASRDLLTAFNSNVPAILEYLKTQQNITQAKIDSVSGGSSGGLSDNYESSISKAIQASTTQKNTDAKNMELLTKVRDQYGSGWYDPNYKVIYMGEDGDRKITAGAYDLINKMAAVNSQNISKSEKEKQLNELLKKLQGKWSYSDAHLTWDSKEKRFHLHKNSGTSDKWQIFHTGVQQGFVSDGKPLTVSSKQRELLAKLQAGEIVLNRTDQERLMVQMQVLEGLADKLKKLDLDSRAMNVDSSPSITLTVEAPVVIQGNADPDALKKLEKFGDEIADKTLTTLNEALRARGYGGHAKSNAMKKR